MSFGRSKEYEIWRSSTSNHQFRERLSYLNRSINIAADSNILTHVFHRLPQSAVVWIYLTILGFLSAILGSIIDYGINQLLNFRQYVQGVLFNVFLSYAIWISWCILFAVLSSFSTFMISVVADGSGIPQMKSLLSNISSSSDDLLSTSTLIAKVLSTVLATGSGLSIGKEGPFIHISSIVASKLSAVGIFNSLVHSPSFHVLRFGVAAGVTAVFGTPLGGVLFSIEVTTNYYDIRNLWKSVICSSVCVLTFEIISTWKEDVLFANTHFVDFKMGWEIISFMTLGLVSGITSTGFIHLVKKNSKYYLTKLANRRFVHVALVAALSSFITFPISSLRISDREVINQMFHQDSISIPVWKLNGSHVLGLFVHSIFKFLITAFPCGLPLSCGIFTPLFALGAVVGRFYGEIMNLMLPAGLNSPASYAVVGAASLAAGATHTVSTAVIVFELTGQLSHMLPVMLSVLVSYSVSGSFSTSIYELLGTLSGVEDFDLEDKCSFEIFKIHKCMWEVEFLTPQDSMREALKILEVSPMSTIPVCESQSSRVLMGAVSKIDLELFLSRLEESSENEVEFGETLCEGSHEEPFLRHSESTPESRTNQQTQVVHRSSDVMDSMVKFGPPLGPFSFNTIPLLSHPPQIGYASSLSDLFRLYNLSMHNEIFVTKYGILKGVIHLRKLKQRINKDM